MKPLLLSARALLCFAAIGFAVASSSNEDTPRHVSIVDLIVRPDQVPERTVAVVGFLSRAMNPYLYLTQGHAALGDVASAVLVDFGSQDPDLPLASCGERYVQIIGHFHLNPLGEFVIGDVEEVWVRDQGESLRRQCWNAERNANEAVK